LRRLIETTAFIRAWAITSGFARHSGTTAGDVRDPQMSAQDCSGEEMRPVCEGLFVSQRDDGIDAHCLSRWEVA